MGVGQLSESDAVDALRLPFYSSSHPTGSHGWRNQFDLGNPDKVESITDEGRLDTAKLTNIDEHTHQLLTRSVLAEDDVLFSIAGTIGRVTWVQKDILPANTNQAVAIVRPNKEVIDPRFLYYILRDDSRIQRARTHVVQSVQANFSLSELSAIEIPVPPMPEQKAIAHILGTLDDKIELNRRMNRTLEEMARAILQDWFVDFGPTRAKMEGQEPYLPPELWDLFPDELVDSELGEIPDGWKIGPLSEYASLNPESWSKKNFPNEIEYVDLANTKWGTIESTQLMPWEAAPSRARRILRSGDTLIGTVRPGNGSYSLAGRNGLTGSTGFAVLRPSKNQFRELVYLAATDPDNIERLTHRADGAAYPAVRPEVVAESQVVSPIECTDLLDRFSDMISSLLDKMESNQTETRSLMALRDEMLPSLVSGELKLESN